jgi:hypothetical protein
MHDVQLKRRKIKPQIVAIRRGGPEIITQRIRGDIRSRKTGSEISADVIPAACSQRLMPFPAEVR